DRWAGSCSRAPRSPRRTSNRSSRPPCRGTRSRSQAQRPGGWAGRCEARVFGERRRRERFVSAGPQARDRPRPAPTAADPYQRSPGTTHLFGSPLCSAVIVAITGTPGTGKSSICSVLGRRGYFIVDLDQEARAGGFIVGRDESRGADEVDVEGLRNHLQIPAKIAFLKGHYSHLMDENLAIVLRCRPSVLRKRLQERGWPDSKIQENVEAEAIDSILATPFHWCLRLSFSSCPRISTHSMAGSRSCSARRASGATWWTTSSTDTQTFSSCRASGSACTVVSRSVSSRSSVSC